MDRRLIEIMELARSGDEDVILQVQSEIALLPETREQMEERTAQWAEEVAESYAVVPQAPAAEDLERLAEDAGF